MKPEILVKTGSFHKVQFFFAHANFSNRFFCMGGIDKIVLKLKDEQSTSRKGKILINSRTSGYFLRWFLYLSLKSTHRIYICFRPFSLKKVDLFQTKFRFHSRILEKNDLKFAWVKFKNFYCSESTEKFGVIWHVYWICEVINLNLRKLPVFTGISDFTCFER